MIFTWTSDAVRIGCRRVRHVGNGAASRKGGGASIFSLTGRIELPFFLMRSQNNWNERYITGDLPWDTATFDSNLKEIVSVRNICPCKALEIGCGTGSNAIWLSRQGFSVTAIDISAIAIKRAIEKAANAGVECRFYARDIMKGKIIGAPFGFVFDRGCFHSFDLAGERKRFAKIVHSHLRKSGLWLTLVGSADEPGRNPGPPRRSAIDIVTAIEPYFQILCLYASHFDSNMEKPPRAWVCLMKKRNEGTLP